MKLVLKLTAALSLAFFTLSSSAEAGCFQKLRDCFPKGDKLNNKIKSSYLAAEELMSARYYKEQDPLIFQHFGDDLYKIIDHYLTFGANENRPISPAFDLNFYIAQYPGLLEHFKGNKALVMEHYAVHGMKECRIASPVFNPKNYLSKYPDLLQAFGPDNCEAAYRHFVDHGYYEGRSGS